MQETVITMFSVRYCFCVWRQTHKQTIGVDRTYKTWSKDNPAIPRQSTPESLFLSRESDGAWADQNLDRIREDYKLHRPSSYDHS